MAPCNNLQLTWIAFERPPTSGFLRTYLVGCRLALRESHDVKRKRNTRWRGVWSLVVLLSSLHGFRAQGQVPFPAVRLGPSTSVFTTITDIKPNFSGYEDYAVWGGTAGAYLQSSRIVGLELRGSVLRRGGMEHQEALLFGPRAALHVWQFAPYVAVLGGVAHSWSWRVPGDRTSWVDEKASPDLTVLFGLDVHLAYHVSVRLGEASYSRIYRGDAALNTLGVSTGLVYRLPW